ncbi:MAG TPA: hypothetical protein VGN41_25900 [Streptosporangiaceae bacterium]
MRRFCCFAPSTLAQGIPITEVSRWPGHKSAKVTDVGGVPERFAVSRPNAGGYLAATVARRLRDEVRTLAAPLRPATEVARRAGHGAAVLLKIYAHCIDGRADAANKRITNALGTQDAQPGAGKGTTTASRDPEIAGQPSRRRARRSAYRSRGRRPFLSGRRAAPEPERTDTQRTAPAQDSAWIDISAGREHMTR